MDKITGLYLLTILVTIFHSFFQEARCLDALDPMSFSSTTIPSTFEIGKFDKNHGVSLNDLAKHRNYHLLPKGSQCEVINSELASITDIYNYGNKNSMFRRKKRVVGGKPISNIPGLVAIYVKNGSYDNNDTAAARVIGTGTLINSRYVLTSFYVTGYIFGGQYIESVQFEGISNGYGHGHRRICNTESVFFDDTLINCPFKFEKRVESVISYPKKVGPFINNENDITLLRLQDEITEYELKPLCLPFQETLVFANENSSALKSKLITGGFGLTSGEPMYPLNPHFIEMKILPNVDCDSGFSNKIGNLTAKKFCAASALGKINLGGICSSQDIGSPMINVNVKMYYQTGLLSDFITCGLPGIPITYTNLTKFLPWILDNIQS